MARVSKDTVEHTDGFPSFEVRFSVLDGYEVDFMTITERHDLGPMLAALPGGRCECPHWGYLFTGRMTVRYDDHEEVVEAGDAFYLPPGHVPVYEAGTSFVHFSPAEQLAATQEALRAAAQQLQQQS